MSITKPAIGFRTPLIYPFRKTGKGLYHTKRTFGSPPPHIEVILVSHVAWASIKDSILTFNSKLLWTICQSLCYLMNTKLSNIN